MSNTREPSAVGGADSLERRNSLFMRDLDGSLTYASGCRFCKKLRFASILEGDVEMECRLNGVAGYENAVVL